jgi:UBA-like domain
MSEDSIKEFCTITGNYPFSISLDQRATFEPYPITVTFFTGATRSVAASLLSACNGSLEMAVNMHMEGIDVPNNEVGKLGHCVLITYSVLPNV